MVVGMSTINGKSGKVLAVAGSISTHIGKSELFRQMKADDYQREHTPIVRTERKIGRNEPCPCRSGKKFKKCHGGANQ